ncbi:3-oxoacyl-ACP synthase [Streptomyces sp. XM4193]|uniref:beta-ketoacyl synthase N-terminal-like domain-containing protein n=1 Tax=Streptomyces sp. XM4193 TaxID=2929782 RepID=UPI001FFAEB46|nr:beta-ketoacyl synthase N-terminal-like domain-containing protein [Streptomyces sp. XM4193]MCK1795667.1 3-oxoacyl-ACP synthase [Streptomyces sp. XM4193]
MRSHAYRSVVITGAGVVLPGADRPEAVPQGRPKDAGPVDTVQLLRGIGGYRGLRYKDRATQLAYCATEFALTDSGLLADGTLTVPAESVGVLASSNTGNLDTVVRVVDTLRSGTTDDLSPMDLPRVSCNVVASSVAIRHGLRGPNLMICNGSTSGADTVRWAATMLRTGRLRRALIIGVEPDTEPTRTLADGAAPLDGAVALVVEDASAAAARGARVRARIGGHARGAGIADCLAALAELEPREPAAWHVPGPAAPDGVLPGVPRYDLTSAWGPSSGALGVLQCVAAVGAFDGGATGAVYTTAGDDARDATAGLVLTPAG